MPVVKSAFMHFYLHKNTPNQKKHNSSKPAAQSWLLSTQSFPAY